MSTEKESQILEALRSVKDPDLGRNIVDLGFVKNMRVEGARAAFTIELTTPACPVKDQMKEQARQAALSVPGIKEADIAMTARVRSSPAKAKEERIPQVKNIIPVASGKGGVGKSTVSANLAIALVRMGAKVGLMDADVYGPSIPRIMGSVNSVRIENRRIFPPEEHGVKIISMGFFLPEGEAVVWRGPMLHKTMEQFIGDVEWGELDYLIVDLPPGTGDVQLSICQIIPLTGAVVVSTPQDVALKIAEKAIIMFEKLSTPILGMIENMSGFICSHCGERSDIFGSGGARVYSLENGIPFLGEILLDTNLREASDAGIPLMNSSPDSHGAKAFREIAQNLAAQVSIMNMGGFGTRLSPRHVSADEGHLRIVWNDGHESLYSSFDVRAACQCALCVDEMSGERRVTPQSIDPNVTIQGVHPVGQYALRFRFSDHHNTGIYRFDHLRSLCSCKECRANQEMEVRR
jgi:ATP-binding protein involved in chromosome partitioning